MALKISSDKIENIPKSNPEYYDGIKFNDKVKFTQPIVSNSIDSDDIRTDNIMCDFGEIARLLIPLNTKVFSIREITETTVNKFWFWLGEYQNTNRYVEFKPNHVNNYGTQLTVNFKKGNRRVENNYDELEDDSYFNTNFGIFLIVVKCGDSVCSKIVAVNNGTIITGSNITGRYDTVVRIREIISITPLFISNLYSSKPHSIELAY